MEFFVIIEYWLMVQMNKLTDIEIEHLIAALQAELHNRKVANVTININVNINTTSTQTGNTSTASTASNPHKNHHKRWTSADKLYLGHSLLEGKTIKQISADLGRSEGAIRCMAKQIST